MGFWTCQSDFEDQKKHLSDPCLGSFLAIIEQNQIITIIVLICIFVYGTFREWRKNTNILVIIDDY